MTDGDQDEVTVLVVEDEPGLADLYANMLTPDFKVWMANSGKQALEIINEEVDIVFLDRRMPGMKGDEVLAEIRDRDYECQVAMLTAAEPDFDIIEMGFDDYIVKPVSKTQLHDAVEKLLARSNYEEKLQEYFSLVSKQAVLESRRNTEELAESEEYTQLRNDIQELRDEVDTSLSEITGQVDFRTVFRDIDKDM